MALPSANTPRAVRPEELNPKSCGCSSSHLDGFYPKVRSSMLSPAMLKLC